MTCSDKYLKIYLNISERLKPTNSSVCSCCRCRATERKLIETWSAPLTPSAEQTHGRLTMKLKVWNICQLRNMKPNNGRKKKKSSCSVVCLAANKKKFHHKTFFFLSGYIVWLPAIKCNQLLYYTASKCQIICN